MAATAVEFMQIRLGLKATTIRQELLGNMIFGLPTGRTVPTARQNTTTGR